MKKSIITAFAALVLTPMVAFAAPKPPKPVISPTTLPCKLTDITGVTVSNCAGFYLGNELKTGTGGTPSGNELAALTLLGFGSSTVIQKFDITGDPGFADFTKMLYGTTVVGFHWGGGASHFDEYDNAGGGGTAFYVFDAGTTGLDKIQFVQSLRTAQSGAALYVTGEPCIGPNCGGGGDCELTGTCVPEPSSYILMASGLFGLGFLARRRRNNA